MVVVCSCQLAMVVATSTVGPEDLPYTTYHFPSPRHAPVVSIKVVLPFVSRQS